MTKSWVGNDNANAGKPQPGRWKGDIRMAHTFTCTLMHIIFSTKERRPLLTLELRQRLFPYMGGMVREMKGTALLINGVEDHVHVPASVPATLAVSEFMKELKGVSSG